MLNSILEHHKLSVGKEIQVSVLFLNKGTVSYVESAGLESLVSEGPCARHSKCVPRDWKEI